MSITPYVFDGGLLTAVATIQGNAAPKLAKRIIKAAAIVNTTAVPVAATVHLVPVGEVADAANMLIAAVPIPAAGNVDSSYLCPELINQGLNADGTIQALGAGLTFKFTAVDII